MSNRNLVTAVILTAVAASGMLLGQSNSSQWADELEVISQRVAGGGELSAG